MSMTSLGTQTKSLRQRYEPTLGSRRCQGEYAGRKRHEISEEQARRDCFAFCRKQMRTERGNYLAVGAGMGRLRRGSGAAAGL